MSVQILIDMNLSPDWVHELDKHDWVISMTNPVTRQIREARHRLGAKFNNLDLIVGDLQRQQRESGRHYVDRSKQTTNQTMQPSGGDDAVDNGESPPATR